MKLLHFKCFYEVLHLVSAPVPHAHKKGTRQSSSPGQLVTPRVFCRSEELHGVRGRERTLFVLSGVVTRSGVEELSHEILIASHS